MQKPLWARRRFTDEEVDWWSDRVALYLRKHHADVTKAMERAMTDLKWRRIERAIDHAFLGT